MTPRIPRNPTDLPRWARLPDSDRSMPMQKRMLSTAVRIIGDRAGGRRGTIGTGFVLAVPSETLAGVNHIHLVTAHHVIDAQPKVEMQASNLFVPSVLYPAFEVSDWDQPLPEVDLAVAVLRHDDEAGGDQVISGIEMESVMPPLTVPALGSAIHYIGYLEPLDRMMVRSGTIGALEQRGIKHQEPMYDYECHLVDCRSYTGFSGSPCFFPQMHPILKEQPKSQIAGLIPDGSPPVGGMAYFSVLCGMFTEYVEDRVPNPQGVVSRYGVGVMLPSREIWRALMTDEQRNKRRELDEERKPDEDSGPFLRQASLSDDDEYARFERLAKQLANTPKPDNDEGREG